MRTGGSPFASKGHCRFGQLFPAARGPSVAGAVGSFACGAERVDLMLEWAPVHVVGRRVVLLQNRVALFIEGVQFLSVLTIRNGYFCKRFLVQRVDIGHSEHLFQGLFHVGGWLEVEILPRFTLRPVPFCERKIRDQGSASLVRCFFSLLVQRAEDVQCIMTTKMGEEHLSLRGRSEK
jgi:hypothetical protein